MVCFIFVSLLVDNFYYCSMSGTTSAPGIDDGKEWKDFQNAVEKIGFDEAYQRYIYQVLASILQFGNIEFIKDPKGEDDTGTLIKNMDQLEAVSDLLQVSKDDLAEGLVNRSFEIRGNLTIIPLDVQG